VWNNTARILLPKSFALQLRCLSRFDPRSSRVGFDIRSFIARFVRFLQMSSKRGKKKSKKEPVVEEASSSKQEEPVVEETKHEAKEETKGDEAEQQSSSSDEIQELLADSAEVDLGCVLAPLSRDQLEFLIVKMITLQPSHYQFLLQVSALSFLLLPFFLTLLFSCRKAESVLTKARFAPK
jgi:hypothetical protein